MGALFGLLASLSITTTEFCGRRIANEIGPVVAASVTSFLATFTALAVALTTQGDPLLGDLGLGALSGIGFGLGISTYLQGVRVSTSAAVSPSSAALTVLIPFSYAAVATTLPPPWSFVGAAGAVVGLVLVAEGGSAAANAAAGLRMGLISGVGYGVGTVLLIETSEAAGQWPIVAQRAAAFSTIAGYALLRRRPLLPPLRFARNAAVAGLAAGMSSVFLLWGLEANAAAASVTASLYPASSVLVGRSFFADSVTRTQLLGLVVVIASAIVIVLS